MNIKHLMERMLLRNIYRVLETKSLDDQSNSTTVKMLYGTHISEVLCRSRVYYCWHDVRALG